MSNFDFSSDLVLDLEALDAASGGVAITERLRGLDMGGSGMWGMDSYDNGAWTDWSSQYEGVTTLPYGYGDWNYF